MNEMYPLALAEGTILAGQYIIKKVLGQGGFGITYMATDHKSGKAVAVKEFFPDTLAYREKTAVISYPGERSDSYEYGKTGFLEEAKTLAEFIGNDNIVKIHSYFEENGTAYFVMDYIEGVSFDEYLKQKGGKISVDEAERILIPIMDALQLVHSKGIVHRDVTPDNIYICNDGTIKLLDFGAARYSLGDKSRSLDVILKHGFAPKEQYTKRGKQGPFTDVYSLAATFYFSITGKRPPDSIERLDEDDLIPPSTLGVQITQYQENALLQALEVQASDRFQTMADFKRVLLNENQHEAAAASAVSAPVVFSQPEPAKPVEPKPAPIEYKKPVEPAPTVAKQDNGSKKKIVIGAVAAAVVAVVGLAVFLMFSGKDKDDAITTAESSSSQSASADSSTSGSPSGDSSSDESDSAESKADDSKSDDSKSDESGTNESKTDDSKPDDSKSDNSKTDSSEKKETTKAGDSSTSDKATTTAKGATTTAKGATTTRAAGTTKATNTTKGTTKQTTKGTTAAPKDPNIVASGSCGANGDNVKYTLYKNGLLNIYGSGAMKNYDNLQSQSPFRNYNSIKSVSISNSITSIGASAFNNCTSLQSITIPNSVTSIGHGAFSSCTSLTSINIPSGVASIGEFAFLHCTSLTSISIPSSVKSISDGTFYGCTNLRSVSIPSTVTSIGSSALRDCESLTSIIIPNGVTCIEENTFRRCERLSSVTIPSSVTSIKQDAFQSCKSLTSIIIPSGVKSIGYYAFNGCRNLSSVSISDSVTSIDKYAFCVTNLKSITIPNSVTSIGEGAFDSATIIKCKSGSYAERYARSYRHKYQLI